MYLRETKRRRKDGSEVRYLQLAHNVRHPESGQSTARIIHNFGRADQVDRDGLARLVRSIMRELDPVDEVMALAGDEGRPVDARRLGAQTPDAEQRGARERALAYVRDLVAQIERLEPEQPSRGVSREQPPGPDLAR